MELDGTATVPLRPLSFRDRVDLPFALIAAHIRPLAAVAGIALVVGDGIVVACVAVADAAGRNSTAATVWTVVLAALAVGWVGRLVLRAAVTAAGVLGRLDWRRLRGMWGRFLAVALAQATTGVLLLCLGLPLFALFAPLVVFAARLRAPWLTAAPALVAEATTAGAALGRSSLLMRGAGWSGAGLWCVTRVVQLVLVLPTLAIPLAVLAVSGAGRWALIADGGAAILLAGFVAELVDAATRAVCYLDRRCRREGMDIRIDAVAAR
jgi:hypothetical protein